MKKTLSILLALVMLMSVMTFPATVNAETTTPYVYYPNDVSQQKIYLTSNSTGDAYIIDPTYHPNGVTVYVGDEIVFTEALDADDDASAYNDEQLLGTYSMSMYYTTEYKEAGDYTTDERKYVRSCAWRTTPGLKLHPPKESAGGAMLLFKDSKLIVNLPVAASRGVYENSDLNYIPFTTSNTKSIGRKESGKPFTLHLHNTGVEFKFTGSTIGFTSEGVSQGIGYCIDGVDGYVYTFPGQFTYILADNLDPNVEHTVKIIRCEEIYTGSPTLISAVTDADAIYATEETEYKIQFIGDSISSGAAMPDYTESYVYLTGKKLGWDTQVYSISGMTMYDYKYDNGTRKNFAMPYIYGGIYPSFNAKGYYTINETQPHLTTWTWDSSSAQTVYRAGTYDFSFIPDVVVINLGTNDKSFLTRADTQQQLDYNKQNFVVYYVDFMQWLTELYGENVQFICSYGLNDGIGNTISTDMIALVQKAADTFNEKTGTTNAHAFTYRQQVDDGIYFGSGDPRNNSHPGVQSHINASDDLVAFIQSELQMGNQITAEADENGKVDLPTPERDGKIFVGWFDKNGDAVTGSTTFEKGEVVTLNAQWLDVEDMLSATVDGDGNENDDNPVPTTAKYTNGLYIQGAQVRTPLDTVGANELGIRFISVVNDDLITMLKTTNGITNVTFGTLVASSNKVSGTLTYGMTGVSTVSATKIWKNSVTLNSNYDKFTACVTNIPEAHLATELLVRPYIRYVDASGNVNYLYGEQYETASIFKVAKLAYESGKETDAVNRYLYTNILSKTLGDNDTEIEF